MSAYELTERQAAALRTLCRRSLRVGDLSEVSLTDVYGALNALSNEVLPPCVRCGEQIRENEGWVDRRGFSDLPYHIDCAPNDREVTP